MTNVQRRDLCTTKFGFPAKDDDIEETYIK